MEITRDFLLAEIKDLHDEVQRAQKFIVQAEATIRAYDMLVRKIDTPEDSGASNEP